MDKGGAGLQIELRNEKISIRAKKTKRVGRVQHYLLNPLYTCTHWLM